MNCPPLPPLIYYSLNLRFMFPHRFLTPHFLTEQQKAELTTSNHQKILAKTKAFSDVLKEGESSEQLSFLYQASNMVMSNALHIKKLSDLFVVTTVH